MGTIQGAIKRLAGDIAGSASLPRMRQSVAAFHASPPPGETRVVAERAPEVRVPCPFQQRRQGAQRDACASRSRCPDSPRPHRRGHARWRCQTDRLRPDQHACVSWARPALPAGSRALPAGKSTAYRASAIHGFRRNHRRPARLPVLDSQRGLRDSGKAVSAQQGSVGATASEKSLFSLHDAPLEQPRFLPGFQNLRVEFGHTQRSSCSHAAAACTSLAVTARNLSTAVRASAAAGVTYSPSCMA